MARGRLISKTLSTSEKRAALHLEAGKLAEFCQSLYPLLVAHSDDFGRLQGDTFTVKHAIDPSSPRRLPDFGRALMALHNVGLIHWYEADGRKYVQIIKFEEHQSGLHKRIRSHFPEPTGQPRKFREIPSEEKRTETKGSEEKYDGADALVERRAEPGVRDAFERYHQRFVERFGDKPRINGGKDGKILRELIRERGIERVLSLIDAFFASPDAFIQGSGYTIGVFASCLNKLLVEPVRGPTLTKRTQQAVDSSAAFLDTFNHDTTGRSPIRGQLQPARRGAS